MQFHRYRASLLSLLLLAAAAVAQGEEIPSSEANGLTLGRALQLALEKSPELAADSLAVRAAEAASLQAKAWPNPELSVELEDFAGSGPYEGIDRAQTTIQLNQLIELGGKRSARLEAGAAAHDLAKWDYEIRRLDVLAATARDFFDVLGFQEHVHHSEESLELVERYAQTARERVAAGAASPAEQLRAQIALGNARLEVEKGRRELTAAKERLAAHWGGAGTDILSAEGDLTALPASLPPVEQLVEQIEKNPDLARWTAELESRKALAAQEKSRLVPDLTVSGGFRRLHDPGHNALVAGLSLPLPLFDRRSRGREQASARLEEGRARELGARARIRSEILSLHAVLESFHAEALAIREEMLPSAREAFEITNEGYRRGRFSLIEVMDAQRIFFEIIERYHLALVAFHQTAVSLERLTGTPLFESTPAKSPEDH
ncbi:MAG: TolC family protein [Bdellovibrionota bacterium]